MACAYVRKLVAICLTTALILAGAPAFAAPAAGPATISGTVYADDVTTPLAGATVVVTDVSGVKLSSQPTGADGRFTVPAVAPGRTALALETKDGTFAVATPVTLAPGETRGVQLALKGKGKARSSASASGSGSGSNSSGMTGGSIAAMTVVLVGFVAAAAAVVGQSGDDPEASPYTPPPSLAEN